MEITQLNELEQDSLKRGIPILGSQKGIWLLDKIKEIKPRKVLELGTAIGYSGIILGSEGGELMTIDTNEKEAEEAMQNFSKFGVNAQVIIGDGVKILKEFKGENIYDLILIDFANKSYVEVLDDCIRLANINGLILADNVKMEGCAEFLEKIKDDSRLQTEIIEIEDGLSCSVKV